MTEIGSSGPEGAGFGCLTLKGALAERLAPDLVRGTPGVAVLHRRAALRLRQAGVFGRYSQTTRRESRTVVLVRVRLVSG
jgi:hypothetical protein